MIGFPKTPPLRWIALALGFLIVATAGADAAPLRYTIADLGDVRDKRGVGNDGQLIDQPVKNLVGHRPFTSSVVGLYFQVVDGAGDGRFLINSEHYSGYERDEFGRKTWVYTGGEGHANDPQWYQQLGDGEASTRLMGVDINARGEVIGQFVPHGPRDSGIYADRSFYASPGSSTIYDLAELLPPDSGWGGRFGHLKAYSINDLGQILGEGRNPEGKYTTFLMTPAEQVPEPGTWAVFGLAAAAFAWRNRRRAA